MATITNLKLAISKGKSSSTVIINYRLCFTKCELIAKTTFIETVSLRGDDAWPDPDDHLQTISSLCVRASKPCIDRKVTRKISNKTLNEDKWFSRKDEVYARVKLRPFVSTSTSANSNIVSDYF